MRVIVLSVRNYDIKSAFVPLNNIGTALGGREGVEKTGPVAFVAANDSGKPSWDRFVIQSMISGSRKRPPTCKCV